MKSHQGFAMPLTLAQLVNAGFPSENFPPELPEPSPDTIKLYDLGNKNELYRYEASVDKAQITVQADNSCRRINF
jgi:hypothetical protein